MTHYCEIVFILQVYTLLNDIFSKISLFLIEETEYLLKTICSLDHFMTNTCSYIEY